MSERLRNFIDRYQRLIETALSDYLPISAQPHAQRLNEALRYAVFPGGKRWRPILTLLGSEVVGAGLMEAMPAACAMEFLHTSSIIIDDLPAMDDAETRRGRESLHLIYGEPVAMLAALALLNESYALLMRAARASGRCGAGARLVEEATRCIGSDGMIGGQAVDLALQGAGPWQEALISRNLKTTALMRLTMMSGAIAGGADEGPAQVLANFGESLGMAYQICDDLLDELGASQELGKPAKQDSRHCRSTFVAELGVEGAQRLATGLIDESKRALRERFGDRPAVEMLSDAAELILRGAGRLTMASALVFLLQPISGF
ncbi:MAG TPA: polyprenyl synthetase family protein [Blastocatellia bacterium]|nr:polyprenyl synthetase family protein [Blastocatellia bacterium]